MSRSPNRLFRESAEAGGKNFTLLNFCCAVESNGNAIAITVASKVRGLIKKQNWLGSTNLRYLVATS